MRKFIFVVALALGIVVVSGCATIMSGGETRITINSNPILDTVVITDEKEKEVFRGETTVVVSLKSGGDEFFQKKDYKVVVGKAGYIKHSIFIESQIDDWYYANLFWSLTGWGIPITLLGMLIIDPGTGAMWTLSPDHINVRLKKE